jgi:hypothetical protein
VLIIAVFPKDHNHVSQADGDSHSLELFQGCWAEKLKDLCVGTPATTHACHLRVLVSFFLHNSISRRNLIRGVCAGGLCPCYEWTDGQTSRAVCWKE